MEYSFESDYQCKTQHYSFSMFLKTILNTIVISVDQIGVVPWCLIWWFIWFLVHTVYKKLFLLLLKRISINEEESKELVKLYWNIAFTSITVPFALQNLKLTYSDVLNKFYYILQNHISTWFSSDPVPSIHIKLSYVILSGYYLNNVCEICIVKGLHSLEFILNELLTLFFISTFPLRCVQFGVAVTTMINSVDFFLSISKLFSCFCDIAQTKYLRFFIYLFLLLHSVLWAAVYFNIVPRYFMYISLKKMRYESDMKHFSFYLLLNGSLLCLYLLILAKSTVTSMVVHFVKSQPTLMGTAHEANGNAQEIKAEDEKIERTRAEKKKENLQTLYQTVKCAIRIKRKLTKIRSRLNESGSTKTIDLNHLSNGHSDVPSEPLLLQPDKKEETEELIER
ncbi:uncharacterized protein [Halyomorpha halys]|uniref:uncharacterized protein n=1 Tax=Halyomorpha halys TaxID=286706 RepID=UPI0006D4F599|nr:uncharacterized protein LOC106686766 [Halyomorpha halys]